jgi:hypothetical protein
MVFATSTGRLQSNCFEFASESPKRQSSQDRLCLWALAGTEHINGAVAEMLANQVATCMLW